MSAVPRVPYADYLAAEVAASSKHEYLRGVVYAMAGGTFEHALLAMNLGRALGAKLPASCVVVGSDARLRIEETDRATYPDLMVVCGSRRPAADDPDATTNPTVIVEVLSDSTEADDRGAKFAHYRRIPSLVDYVLVSQREHRIEVYTREAGGWRLSEASAGGYVRLASVAIDVEVDAVYQGIPAPI